MLFKVDILAIRGPKTSDVDVLSTYRIDAPSVETARIRGLDRFQHEHADVSMDMVHGRAAPIDPQITPCPYCRKELYRTRVIDGWHMSDNSPPIQSDERGIFIKCPSCEARVAMLQIPTGQGDPSQFQVAPGQGMPA